MEKREGKSWVEVFGLSQMGKSERTLVGGITEGPTPGFWRAHCRTVADEKINGRCLCQTGGKMQRKESVEIGLTEKREEFSLRVRIQNL